MRKITMGFYERGQSLVELIMAFFIMALVVVAIVGLSTISVRNSSSARDKSVARRYAEEGIEWVKKRRDLKWQSLWEHGDSSLKTYCFNTFPQSDSSWVNGSCASGSFIPGTIFSRELKLQRDGENALNVQVIVKWGGSQDYHEVKLETKLYNLE